MDKKFYVYGHYLKGTNELFYIGKGTRDRATAVGNRNPAWQKKVKDKEWYSVLLFSGMTSKEALQKEYELLVMLKHRLVNTLIQTKSDPVLQDLSDNFYYDETSPTCLRWKHWNRAYAPAARREAGDVAGSLKFRKGAKVASSVMLKQQHLQISWVVWYLNKCEYPDSDFVIDHIDGDPHNNKIENLRLITYAQNSRNRIKQSNNTTGTVGIYKMNNGWGRDYIVGKVVINGKSVQKYFDVRNLGESEAFRLACNWRSTQIALLNDQGAGYTSRHGQ